MPAKKTTAKRGPGRPPKKRGPGRPPKSETAKKTASTTKTKRSYTKKAKTFKDLDAKDVFAVIRENITALQGLEQSQSNRDVSTAISHQLMALEKVTSTFFEIEAPTPAAPAPAHEVPRAQAEPSEPEEAPANGRSEATEVAPLPPSRQFQPPGV